MKDIVQMVRACPINTAGRPLELEEIQLRTSWIYAVALMLDHIEYRKATSIENGTMAQPSSNESDEIADSIRCTFGPVLSTIVELQRSGGSLNTQEFIQQHKALLPESIYDDDIQLVIASQTIKVLWYTLTVLDEERIANDVDDMSELPVARPQIPRGEGIN
jgi:hypothetical protein